MDDVGKLGMVGVLVLMDVEVVIDVEWLVEVVLGLVVSGVGWVRKNVVLVVRERLSRRSRGFMRERLKG